MGFCHYRQVENNIIEINLKGKSDSLAYKKLLRPYSSFILFGSEFVEESPNYWLYVGRCARLLLQRHDKARQNVGSLLWPWPREANTGQAHCPDPLNERGEQPLLSPPAGMSEADRPGTGQGAARARSNSCRDRNDHFQSSPSGSSRNLE